MELLKSASFVVVILTLGIVGLAAQERHPFVNHSDNAVLRKTALRLRISPEDLKDRRELLNRATELALTIEDPSAVTASFSGLAAIWIELDRENAPATIRILIDKLRSVAKSTSASGVYVRVTNQAITLTQQLGPLLPEGSSATLEPWPNPPASDDWESGGWKQRLLTRQMWALMHEDPRLALRRLNEIGENFQDPDFRFHLMHKLLRENANEEAGELLDEMLDSMLTDPTTHPVYSASRLATYAFESLPERLPEILDAWYRVVLMSPPGRTYEIQVNGQLFRLTSSEQSVLSTIGDLWFNKRPTLALGILAWFPELEEKLESVGGLDGYLSRNRHTTSEAEERHKEIRALAGANPRELRLYLGGYDDPREQIWVLLHLASVSRSEFTEPARRRDLLDQAVQTAWQLEESRELASIMQRLAGLYRQSEGQFPPELVNLFYETVNRLEEDLSSSEKPFRHHLIPYFVAHWLMVDRSSALAFLAARGDAATKFGALYIALSPGCSVIESRNQGDSP